MYQKRILEVARSLPPDIANNDDKYQKFVSRAVRREVVMGSVIGEEAKVPRVNRRVMQ